MLKFNINDNVKVKLTPFGKKVHKEDYYDFWNKYDIKKLLWYKSPKEDEYGYSTWKLWDLMASFGEYLKLGAIDLPFETEILLVE